MRQIPESGFLSYFAFAEGWQPIETAPRDGRLIVVYAPGRDGLPAIICPCSWHPDAGFCVDEIREPSHWTPYHPPAVREGDA